jgi:hypothetical protein
MLVSSPSPAVAQELLCVAFQCEQYDFFDDLAGVAALRLQLLGSLDGASPTCAAVVSILKALRHLEQAPGVQQQTSTSDALMC